MDLGVTEILGKAEAELLQEYHDWSFSHFLPIRNDPVRKVKTTLLSASAAQRLWVCFSFHAWSRA